jgi:hypothetical protein
VKKSNAWLTGAQPDTSKLFRSGSKPVQYLCKHAASVNYAEPGIVVAAESSALRAILLVIDGQDKGTQKSLTCLCPASLLRAEQPSPMQPQSGDRGTARARAVDPHLTHTCQWYGFDMHSKDLISTLQLYSERLNTN